MSNDNDLRHIRNSARFIAWVIGIVVVVAIVAGFVLAHMAYVANQQSNQPDYPATNSSTLGG
jgi:uncharacterized membrane protein YdfJ with MMPL/SSD domain